MSSEMSNLVAQSPTGAAGIELIASAAFAAQTYEYNWLVRDIFVKNEPAVIGGPPKTLKTSTAVDLGLSLASGTPFLGKFEVPHRRRVAIFSGEQGAGELQRLARRICAAKGITLESCLAHWGFRLPQLGLAEDLQRATRL